MENTRSKIVGILQGAGLRLTDQRLLLGQLLFAGHDRHVTAEELHDEADEIGSSIALATVYNTLKLFTAAGLVREVAISGPKAYFDTNTDNHCHFYIAEESRLVDATFDSSIVKVPSAPKNTRISQVDIVIHLERKG